MQQNVNSPQTSSCGRLFDAVSALLGIRQTVTYEAQAAIELEMAIGGAEDDRAYSFSLIPEGERLIIGTRPLFAELVDDLRKGTDVGILSRCFHDGLTRALAKVAEMLRTKTGLNRICLSGGSFNNIYLSYGLELQLKRADFEVFTHSEVPAGDGGLSLGQAMIAAHRIKAAQANGSSVGNTRSRDPRHIA